MRCPSSGNSTFDLRGIPLLDRHSTVVGPDHAQVPVDGVGGMHEQEGVPVELSVADLLAHNGALCRSR